MSDAYAGSTMTGPNASNTGTERQPGDMSRMWDTGWRRYIFPAFWLIYLGQTISGVHKHSTGVAAVAGYVIVVAFAACYLVTLPLAWHDRGTRFWTLYGAGLALTAVECFFAHGDALVFLVYTAVLTVATSIRAVVPIVLVLTLIGGGLPAVVPGWGGSFDWNFALTVLLVSIAMIGFFKIIQANIALSQARADLARLAAENERSRIARDLHDLLGHSLTTITVKAGLARRLGEHGETARALTEIAEVEALSRRTLGDVRAAVSAHREVTLAGELATAREVLRAAGIIAELPPTVAETDPALSELFGWIIREGVTNVVRHSHAEHVRITLGRTDIEIVDDGSGGGACGAGNGLSGLRERAEEAGGTLSVGGVRSGFRLYVDVPVGADAAPLPEVRPTPAHESSGAS
jgi:two-component system sensor histidine kinase DesK